MTSARVPVELRRRLQTWERLLAAHAVDGGHHDLLCATKHSCHAYGEVIHAQVELLQRAGELPAEDQFALADALSAPGRRPLRELVERAEQRLRDGATT